MYSEIELSERAYNEIIRDANQRLLRVDDITELDTFTKHAVFRLQQADAMVTRAVEAACCTENTCPAEEHNEMLSQALQFFDNIEAEIVKRDRLNRWLVATFSVLFVLSMIAIIGSTDKFLAMTGFEFPFGLPFGRTSTIMSGVALGGLSIFILTSNPLSVRSKADRQLSRPVGPAEYACILRELQSFGQCAQEEMIKFPVAATHLLYDRRNEQRLTVLKFLTIMAAIARTRLLISNASDCAAAKQLAKQLDEYLTWPVA